MLRFMLRAKQCDGMAPWLLLQSNPADLTTPPCEATPSRQCLVRMQAAFRGWETSTHTASARARCRTRRQDQQALQALDVEPDEIAEALRAAVARLQEAEARDGGGKSPGTTTGQPCADAAR